jgi:energy-coupling factor transporter ATP-binding protein EcfA2
LTGREFDKEETASASLIVGKDYKNCTVYEIRDYGPLEIWPYFKVTCGSITYGSEEMGRGELAVLTSLWTITNQKADSILILEEPETHVSARAQSAMMDTLAAACSKKGLCIIVTTHSPVILKKLQKTNIRLLVSDEGKSRLISNPTLPDLATVVGGGVAYQALILVEDECAHFFAQTILEMTDMDLNRQCTFGVTKGEARIKSLLTDVPKAARWAAIVGCFDGDMRGPLAGATFAWPHLFLPGEVAPEIILKAALQEQSARLFADELNVDLQRATVALGSLIGLNHHDWLRELAGELGRTLEDVVRAITRLWLIDSNPEAVNFTLDLKRKISHAA